MKPALRITDVERIKLAADGWVDLPNTLLDVLQGHPSIRRRMPPITIYEKDRVKDLYCLMCIQRGVDLGDHS